jgi:hypothetical protein
MKPTDDIHKLIKKLEIKASCELDRKVHNDISLATAESAARPKIWRTKLAVAAAVIIAFGGGFFIGQKSKSAPPANYSLDVNGYTSAASAYPADEGGFWRQKAVAAMRPRPYTRSRFSKTGLFKTYKQYLKEKHYD